MIAKTPHSRVIESSETGYIVRLLSNWVIWHWSICNNQFSKYILDQYMHWCCQIEQPEGCNIKPLIPLSIMLASFRVHKFVYEKRCSDQYCERGEEPSFKQIMHGVSYSLHRIFHCTRNAAFVSTEIEEWTTSPYFSVHHSVWILAPATSQFLQQHSWLQIDRFENLAEKWKQGTFKQIKLFVYHTLKAFIKCNPCLSIHPNVIEIKSINNLN